MAFYKEVRYPSKIVKYEILVSWVDVALWQRISAVSLRQDTPGTGDFRARLSQADDNTCIVCLQSKGQEFVAYHLLKFNEAPCQIWSCKGCWKMELQMVCKHKRRIERSWTSKNSAGHHEWRASCTITLCIDRSSMLDIKSRPESWTKFMQRRIKSIYLRHHTSHLSDQYRRDWRRQELKVPSTESD